MTDIVQGRIVYSLTPVSDPQGKNPKIGRPFVVISTPEQIANGEDLELIAITGTITGGADEVELPYSNNKKRPSMTGLTRKSVALCGWRTSLPQKDIRIGGFVRPSELLAILVIVGK